MEKTDNKQSKSSNAINIDKFIEELRNTVISAELNYAIWWVYKSKNTRPQYIDEMNNYLLFFHTSIDAHFAQITLTLYRLYEKRKQNNTYNIPYLLKEIKKSNSIDKASLDEAEQLYDKAKPLLKKVSILRNKIFAHNSKEHEYEEVFNLASVAPDEFKELIKITKELLNKISYAWNRSTHTFNLDSRETTIRLLKDLKELAKIRSNNRIKPT